MFFVFYRNKKLQRSVKKQYIAKDMNIHLVETLFKSIKKHRDRLSITVF